MERFEVPIGPAQITAMVIFVLIVLFEILFPFRKYLRRIRHYSKNVVFSLINTIITGLSGAAMSLWVFL